MDLTHTENAVIEALSYYVVNGELDPNVSVAEIAAQSGLSPEEVNGALSRLMGRNWISGDHPCRYRWTESDSVALVGEGLARAAALAARRELTLFQVKIGEVCYYISYTEPNRQRGERRWSACIHRADAPGTDSQATATGVTRAKARDALVQTLRASLSEPNRPLTPRADTRDASANDALLRNGR